MDILILILLLMLVITVIALQLIPYIRKVDFKSYVEELEDEIKEEIRVNSTAQIITPTYKRVFLDRFPDLKIESKEYYYNPLIEPILVYTGTKKVIYPDDKFPRNMLYWAYGESEIDLTYIGLCTLNIIDSVRSNNSNYLKDFINKYSFRLYRFLEINFHEENGQGGFKHSSRAWPTLYGDCTALGILYILYDLDLFKDVLGKDKVEDLLGKDNCRKFISFLKNCCVDTSYGVCYAEAPYENPTLVDLNNAVHIFYNLALYEELGDEDINNMRKFIFKCLKRLKSEDNIYRVGFSNFPTINKPCSSLTRYALNTLLRLFALEKKQSIRELFDNSFSLDEIISQKDQVGIFNFLVTCRAEDGSFSAYAYDHNHTDVYHTTTAINLLNEVMNSSHGFELKKEDIILLDELQKYLNKCKVENEGFDILPNNYKVSSLYATRCALRILLSLKQLFHEKGKIGEEEKFMKDIKIFVDSCVDKKNGAFYGYAIAPK